MPRPNSAILQKAGAHGRVGASREHYCWTHLAQWTGASLLGCARFLPVLIAAVTSAGPPVPTALPVLIQRAAASQTVACPRVGPITGVPRLAIRPTHSLSADSSHRRFARPRARHTRATRNRLELRYCWPRHPCSRRGQEADLTSPIRLLTTATGEIRLVTSAATMMELRYLWPAPRGHARRESRAGVLDQAPLWPGDGFRAKSTKAAKEITPTHRGGRSPLGSPDVFPLSALSALCVRLLVHFHQPMPTPAPAPPPGPSKPSPSWPCFSQP